MTFAQRGLTKAISDKNDEDCDGRAESDVQKRRDRAKRLQHQGAVRNDGDEPDPGKTSHLISRSL